MVDGWEYVQRWLLCEGDSLERRAGGKPAQSCENGGDDGELHGAFGELGMELCVLELLMQMVAWLMVSLISWLPANVSLYLA